MIDTQKVTGRRTLKFSSWDDIRRDAQELAAGDVTCLGNWSAGQVFSHCAQTMHAFLDRHAFQPPPWWARILGRVLKNRILNGTMRPGFRIPDPVLAPLEAVTTAQGVADLEKAIHRWQTSEPPPSHPFFGSMSGEDWDKLHLRHCEMHFSFLRQKESRG